MYKYRGNTFQHMLSIHFISICYLLSSFNCIVLKFILCIFINFVFRSSFFHGKQKSSKQLSNPRIAPIRLRQPLTQFHKQALVLSPQLSHRRCAHSRQVKPRQQSFNQSLRQRHFLGIDKGACALGRVCFKLVIAQVGYSKKKKNSPYCWKLVSFTNAY